MRVLLDTPIWSFALRRRRRALSPGELRLVGEWATLIRHRRVVMVGPVRQELLSGVRDPGAFERLRDRLRAFPDEPLTTEDYERAAYSHNRCRASGIAGSAVDFLLCAVALRLGTPVFTTDLDFVTYARVLPLALHRPA